MHLLLRAAPLCLALLAAGAWAKDDETQTNRYYVESDKDKPWAEVALPMPDYPGVDAQWLPLYISNTHEGKPQLMRNSIRFAPDGTVHYILNRRSAQGHDNLSAEALHCAARQIKVFAYGDTVNRRWIEPRQRAWQALNLDRSGRSSHVHVDPVRLVLHKTFCEDGLPRDDQELNARLHERAMR